MKKYLYIITIITIGLSGCGFFEAEEVFNPNQADASPVLENATITQMQNLVTGLESRHKNYVQTTSRAFGTFGREVFVFFDSDPRFTDDWLGRALPPDPNFFLVGAAYTAPYQAIKQGNFTMEAGVNSGALTDEQRRGLDGFVKTIQAYQYMIPLNGQFEGGIRIDVADQNNPGPFVSYDDALVEILALLDEAQADLNAGGSEFFFTLQGFDGFNTPATFITLNRAIKARAAIYAKDWSAALNAVNASFLNLSGDINIGPVHAYGGPPDTFNPFFFPLDDFSNQIVVVHPSVLADIEDGDNRADKFLMRTAPDNLVANTEFSAYVGTHQDNRYKTNTDDVKFLRNEELILIYAEAQAQLGNLPEAVVGINAVRTAAGLADYVNPGSLNGVVDQILTERRFSLWFEPWGHRWIDARRYDKLDEIPTLTADETIFTQLARPQSELNFEAQKGN